MSKRGNMTHGIKVKKRRGVGSRTITVLDSDEDEATNGEYARVTNTRVGSSGKAERVSVTSVPVLEAEQFDSPAPLEDYMENPVDLVESAIPLVPAKQQKTINDSVSDPSAFTSALITDSSLDQDAILASCAVRCAR